jgi:hypothetical protein
MVADVLRVDHAMRISLLMATIGELASKQAFKSSSLITGQSKAGVTDHVEGSPMGKSS